MLHNKEYVRKDDRNIHTQSVESSHKWAKESVLVHRSRAGLSSYLNSYSYRRNYFLDIDRNKLRIGKRIKTFLGHVRQVYAGPQMPGMELVRLGTLKLDDLPYGQTFEGLALAKKHMELDEENEEEAMTYDTLFK